MFKYDTTPNTLASPWHNGLHADVGVHFVGDGAILGVHACADIHALNRGGPCAITGVGHQGDDGDGGPPWFLCRRWAAAPAPSRKCISWGTGCRFETVSPTAGTSVENMCHPRRYYK